MSFDIGIHMKKNVLYLTSLRCLVYMANVKRL